MAPATLQQLTERVNATRLPEGTRDRDWQPPHPSPMLIAPVATPRISDAILAPKPFKGTSAENADFWLEYFERYVAYRQLPQEDANALFCMLQHENASDLNISTLPNADWLSLDRLKEAFKQNYFRSPELKWRDASDLLYTVSRPIHIAESK